jgi:CHASE2 domain-containing sensor protein
MRDVQFSSIRISEFLTDVPKNFPVSCPTLTPDSRLKDRIVVLGGTYSRADLHETPWGTRQGAELVAMAVEQLFDPTPLRAFSDVSQIVLETLIAILIAAIHHWIRPFPATFITLILLAGCAVVSSEVMLFLGGYEFGLIPFILGLLIHQLVCSAERATVVAEQLENISVRAKVQASGQ